MRLTAIKLAGFKSFVDPTVIKFPTNLMAVVGPNGCGKSNIIDAVRWVMGESSARQLRGESMSDVIFSGSSVRKPVTTSTVELVFDNSDGRAGGEYASYNEIAVKRQVSRDGQSSYYLNGTKCRRKDITDLFLGTGLGPRSYAIIEQGMISQIVEARPEDLRSYLEEAAGISRYKERRRETENRIRHTRENLERLHDLREEVNKQLDKLKRQSKAAERYRKLKQRYRHDEARLLALRWRTLSQKRAEDEKNLRETENRLQAALARQRSAEKELEGLRDTQQNAREATSKIQAELYDVGSRIARLEQDIEHQRELRKRQEAEYEETESRLNELKQHLQLDRAQVEELTGSLARLEPELERLKAAEQAASEELEAAEQAVTDWQQRWEAHQAEAAETERRTEVLRMRIEHFDERMSQASDRLKALAGESGDQALAGLDAEIAEGESALGELESELESARTAESRQREDLAEVRGAIDEHRQSLEALQSSRHEKNGRLESLRVLNRPDDDGEALASWCREHGIDPARRLMDSLDVDEAWTAAVEVALGAWLQALPVNELATLAGEARPVDGIALFEGGSGTSTPGRLSEKARGAGGLTPWLDTIVVADDLDDARSRLSELSAHESVITPEGDWLGPGWLHSPDRREAGEGVLDRSRQIRALETELEQVDDQLGSRQSELEDARTEAERLEQRVGEAEQARGDIQQRLAQQQGVLSGLRNRREAMARRREEAREEQARLEQRMAEDGEAVSQARGELEQAMSAMESVQQQREPLLAEREQHRAHRDAMREKVRAAREAREKVALELNSQTTNLDSLRQSISRSDSQVAQLQNRFVELSEALARGAQPEKDKQVELNGLLEQRVEVDRRLSEARSKLDDLESQWREHEKARQEASNEADAIREEQSSAQLALREVQLKAEGLAERIGELDQDLETLLGELPEDADPDVWTGELEKLDSRIRKMEPVNLAAIEEYEAESERKEYLDAQDKDLNDALETLEQAIARIDRTTRTRFKETFDRVNKGLETLYPRLFGGGHAYLDLVGDDLLTAGVAILARPPGKRVARIHLLSGGEKALTAVAFVFAIFNLNPAPFCLLDEVDAPLDDANVGRFSDMVREMSDKVQFVMVTHNKVTMEIAHQMVGVTMREAGVSRLVSVDLDKAVALAAS